jgi:uncharacterized protein (DUF433 family)
MKNIAPHICLDDRGVAWIDDTNIKVIEVAAEYRAHRPSPEEMVYQHYGQYSLAQVHAALAYYYDHQAEFDAEIDRQLKEYEELRAAAGESPVRKRLRAMGNLP